MFTKDLFAKLLLLTIACGTLIGHYFLHQFLLPAESALHLSEAAAMLEGAVFYVTLQDNASPFLLWLNLVPAAISQLVFCHPILILNLLIVLVFFLSGLALSLLSQLDGWRNPLKGTIWFILPTFILLVLSHPNDFAQTNQLFCFLIVPYIAARALSLRKVILPAYLSICLGLGAALGALLDPLYLIFFLLFEGAVALGFYPFVSMLFFKKRFLTLEFKIALATLVLSLAAWLLIPSDSTRHYLADVVNINLDNYAELLNALCYCGNSSDMRPEIYASVFFLVVAAARFGKNILCRLFAVAALLSLALLIGQTATLHFQAYPLLAFSALAFAACVKRPLLKYQWPFLPQLRSDYFAPALSFIVVVSAIFTYGTEYATAGKDNLFKLQNLGYHGVADKRDLAIFADVIETYSKPRQKVAVLGLGVRPAYPVLTQLRRKPGFTLTWGFPLDIMHIMEAPMYDKEMARIKDFKAQIFATLINQLNAPADQAPVLVLIDEGEVRGMLEQHGVIKALDEHYANCGGASLADNSADPGHPPMEWVGYKNGFGIYRRK